MEQLGIFNQRPLPPNPWPHGSQKWRLYERLKEGPATNAEIVRTYGIFNSTGRCSEIREYLAPHGYRLECRRVDKGLFEYSIH